MFYVDIVDNVCRLQESMHTAAFLLLRRYPNKAEQPLQKAEAHPESRHSIQPTFERFNQNSITGLLYTRTLSYKIKMQLQAT